MVTQGLTIEWRDEEIQKRRRVPYELMGVAKAHLRGVNGETPGHFLQLKQCLV